MLNEQEIQHLLSHVVALHRQAQSALHKADKPLPEYHPTYTAAIDMAEAIRVHSAMHSFPQRLFRAKAPNEDPAQFAYRKENYRPVTMPFWNRALQVLNRIWNEQNYLVHWPEREDAGQQEYFCKEYPAYTSLIAYFESVVTRWKVNDPNAVLCIRPESLPVAQNEEGEWVALDNVPVSPVAALFPSERVIQYEQGRYCLIELPEKSPVKFGNSIVQEGLIYELYDEENIYRITQVGRKADYTFETELYYPHQLGWLPVYKLRGIPMEHEGKLLYKSHFYDAVPLLDTALYDSSTLDISKVGAAFPHRWAVVEDCNYQGCNGEGSIYQGEGEERRLVTCRPVKAAARRACLPLWVSLKCGRHPLPKILSPRHPLALWNHNWARWNSLTGRSKRILSKPLPC